MPAAVRLREDYSAEGCEASLRMFFATHPLLVSGSVKLEFVLNYFGMPYYEANGFSFTYDFATSPVAATPIATAFDFPVFQSSTVPEPSTWAMMLLGFAGLGYAGMRRSYGLARGGIGLAA
jgi:hypothetical protein